MSEKREGEALVISIRGLDAAGQQMSETTHEINGLDNATANMIYHKLIDGVEALMDQLGKEKGAGNLK